jgi:hypothetical protein
VKSRGGWVRWLDLVPAALAVGLASKVVGGWLARVGYPFDLEWMEGGMLAHAWRVAHGLPLYPDPGPDWVPFVYPPGYPALVAALSPVFGLGYPLGRGISAVATLVAAAGVATLVARSSRRDLGVGIAAAGVFLGCWRASGAFYDLVRPDGLSAALVAWTLVAARERGRFAPVVAGLLLALAFPVKHHVAALGIPLVLGLWIRDGRPAALKFALASAGPAGLFTIIEALWTRGRFLQYLIAVPSSHPTVWDRVVPGTPGELAQWLLPALVAGAAWLVGTMPTGRLGVPRWALLGMPAVLAVIGAGLIWRDPEVRGVGMPPVAAMALAGAAIGAGLGAGLASGLAGVVGRSGDLEDPEAPRWWLAWGVTGTVLVVAAVMRGHNGGFMNVLMPMHLALSAGLGLVVVDLRRRFDGWPIVLATQALLVLQLAWVGVQLDVDEILPTPADRLAGEQVLARLRRCPEGPIFSPFAAWLPAQVGRDPSTHLITLWDIDHADGPFVGDLARIRAAAREHHWSCVVQGGRQRMGYGIDESYQVDTTFQFDPKAMMMKTGWRVRPTSVLVPKGAP